MKKILFILLLISFNVYSQGGGMRVKDLQTTTTGSTNDYLIKDDSAGNPGSTKKIKVSAFKTLYGVGSVTSVGATGGTGITVTGSLITTSGTLTVTNTAPDQTVTIGNGTGISATGTYPTFTITNTSPDQTVTIGSGTNISVTGTYPTFTVTNTGGTVTSVTVTPNAGVSASVANSTTTPVMTFSLGNITPTSVTTNTVITNYLRVNATSLTDTMTLKGGLHIQNPSGTNGLRVTRANVVNGTAPMHQIITSGSEVLHNFNGTLKFQNGLQTNTYTTTFTIDSNAVTSAVKMSTPTLTVTGATASTFAGFDASKRLVSGGLTFTTTTGTTTTVTTTGTAPTQTVTINVGGGGNIASANLTANASYTTTFTGYTWTLKSGSFVREGSGSTSATTTALFQNSSASPILTIKDDIKAYFGATQGTGDIAITNASTIKQSIQHTNATSITSRSVKNCNYLQLGGTEYGVDSYRLVQFGYNDGTLNSPAYFGYQEKVITGNTYGDLVAATRSVTTDTEPTERMRIKSDGTIGISQPLPTATLDVISTLGVKSRVARITSTYQSVAGTSVKNSNYLQIGGQEYGTDSYRLIGFGYNNAGATLNSPAYIGFQEKANASNTYGHLVFMTRSVETDTEPSTRMTIKSTGVINITPMTATAASAVTAAEGDIVFVSDTNGTFTSIGFWGYQNGAWAKM